MELYNGSGILVRTIEATVRDANQTFTLETGDLPAGIYFIRISAGDQAHAEKFVIQ